ncbi:MAG TPA: tetratricopeptide repeat protein [Candidatus Sumerlaeota bacterium]|nr:tetratricopeptide repeat protein [Candidatus Sumerlaeota bacterium]HON50978.1 tetratricopeptide repeat protein [Candidatus Sumerlaeota bacterium]HOR65766.1 tetratricopeptide repeat protein [Candidatus Sumerlaeota bacterium]HPL75522.1 tetratricopeptide repeat protein [Candidatus Sumerlaeota bacterium]
MIKNNPDTKVCPWCGEEIKKKAIICRFCFQDVTQAGIEAAQRMADGAAQAAVAGPEGAPAAPTIEPSVARLTRFVPKTLIEGIVSSADTMEEGERRPIAVLFSDLSGFTSLTEHLGAERMSDLLDEIYASSREIIARYDGVVEKFIGDAVMAIFGAPVAHGDDPERAIRSAFDIRDAVRHIGQQHGFKLDTHAGIAYGEVVFKASKDGGGLDVRSIGDAVNLASRLQGKAADGEIVADHRIFRQTKNIFSWESLEDVSVKGKKHAISIHKAKGIKKQFAKVILGERMELFTLVGREREMALLNNAADKTSKGKGNIVIVQGDAGVGKSRLIYEFYQTIKNRDFFWHTGRCLSFGTNIPFFTFITMLRSFLDLPREMSGPPLNESLLRERLDRIFEKTAKPSDSTHKKNRISKKAKQTPDVFYSLAILFSVDLENNPLLELSPRDRRQKIFDSMTDLFSHLASCSPSIFVFEDFHWADAESLDLLDHLIIELADKPAMFLIALRPGLEHEFPHPEKTQLIKLEELSEKDSRELIAEIMGTKSVPMDLRNLILQKTEGNPFYIEEVILELQEKGLIEKKGKSYQLKTKIEKISIPDTVEGVVLARIDRLERKVKQVLQCASVIGQEFRYHTLAQIAEVNKNLQNYLISLVDGEYILEETAIPELMYIFKHIILRDVTYGTLLDKRKCFFHARVANALENLFEDRIEEFVEIIAHHYERGTIWDKAAYYLERAAIKCEMLYAQRAAADYWERQIASVEKMETSEMERRVLRLRGNLRLGELCRRLGRPQRGITALLEALEDAEELQQTPDKLQVLRRLAEVHRLAGNMDKALNYINEALAIARKIKNAAEIAACYNFISHIERWRGNFHEAKNATEQVLAFAKSTGDRQKHYQALNHYAIICMYFGDSKTAHESFLHALALTRELGKKNEEVQILLNIGINHLRCGECEQAKIRFNEGLALAEKIEFEQGAELCLLAITDLALKCGDIKSAASVSKRLFLRMKEAFFSDIMAMAASNQGRIYLAQGDIKKAKSSMEDAYAIARADENYAVIIDALCLKTELLLAEGQNEHALAAAKELMSLIDAHKELEFLSTALALNARCHLALDNPAEAAKWAEKAVEAAQRSGIPRDEAWATYILAQCVAAAKQPETQKLAQAKKLAMRVMDKALLKLIG